MKRLITTGLAVLLLATTAAAQTDPGFHIIGSARTYDVVKSPTVGHTVLEAGAFSKRLGITAVGMMDSKFQNKLSAVGLKAYVTLFTADELNFKFGAEALRLIEAEHAWRNWAFVPELSMSAHLTGGLGARVAIDGFYHREVFRDRSIKKERVIIDRWRICRPGAAFSLYYNFGKKKKNFNYALK